MVPLEMCTATMSYISMYIVHKETSAKVFKREVCDMHIEHLSNNRKKNSICRVKNKMREMLRIIIL